MHLIIQLTYYFLLYTAPLLQDIDPQHLLSTDEIQQVLHR